MKQLIYLIIFFCTCAPALGQRYVLPDSISVFGQRVADMMEQTGSAHASEVGGSFNAAWGSYSNGQKEKIMDLARNMLLDEVSVIPVIQNYFDALSAAVGAYSLSGTQVDDLLDVIEKSYGHYPVKSFNEGLQNLITLFRERALFKSNYSTLYFDEANLSFEFTGAADETLPSVADQMLDESSKKEQTDEWGTGNDSWGNDDGWGNNNQDDGWGNDNGDDGWGNNPTDSSWGSEEPKENKEEQSFASADDALASYGNAMEAVVSGPVTQASGAIIKFDNTNLAFVTRHDSVILKNTSGKYEYSKFVFTGEGGIFDWSLAGFEPGKVQTTLKSYSLDTRLPEFTADQVKHQHNGVFDGKVEGHFEFKSVKRDSTGNGSYPRFYSYNSDIEFTFDYEDLYCRGGYSLEGRKLGNNALNDGASLIEVSVDNRRNFKAISKDFVFQDTVILGRKVDITVYHSSDSINHPSTKFRYYTNQKRLIVTKEDDGYDLRPYNSSYFNMDITADMIDWDITTDSMNITILNARSMLPAYFASKEYYNSDHLDELSGVYNFNPLVLAYSYGKKVKARQFYVDDLIRDMKLNEKAVKSSMSNLLFRGFIEYNKNTGLVYLKDKLLHFIRSKYKWKDYDDLMISSLSPNAPNATLHLDNNEMTVRGIDKFYISEILDVYIEPKDKSITLLKDRDFTFKGQLFAGNFEFAGHNFTFKYDSFLVDLANIDSVKFYVEGEDMRKKEVDNKLVSVDLYGNEQGAAGSTSGTLYINKPDNKSGAKIFPEYPVFDASRGAVVYFDNADILDSAYDKSLYFYVPPFGIDSLSAEDPAAIGFEGTFFSDGRLPEFKEKLKIMPDNSLGFTHAIPPDGYNVFGGSGKVYQRLSLDKNGLVVDGKLEYLTSSSKSDAYTFYLDSIVGEGRDYEINAANLNGASYPDVYTPSFKMNWQPKVDKMYVSNLEEPFDIYNNTATFNGTTILSAQGVNGSGFFEARGFEAESDEFTFKETELTARHSDFVVASQNPEKPLMQGEDIRLDFDLTANIGDLSPEVEGQAALEFPFAQVKTSISQAQWNLSEEKVYMEKPEDVDIRSSYFYTTREELDSLAFNASGAVYDIQSSELNVTGIPYINVADALITPENNEVLILENATIGTLENTKIVIDSLYGYHNLFDGTIDIVSSKKFTGRAKYQLVNAVKDTFSIQFESFELREVPEAADKSKRGLQTVSGGEIKAEDRLVISPGMLYKGDVTMYAQQKPLKLDGYVKLDFQNTPDYDTWISYNSQDEETQEVIFNYNTATTEDGKSLNAGLHYGSFDNTLYGTFLSERKNISDPDFFTPHGFLWFEEEQNEYIIMDTAKAYGNSYAGSMFAYNELTGNVRMEGMFNFLEPSESIQLRASGLGQGNINERDYTVNTFSIFEYDVPDAAFVEMHRDIFETVEAFGAPAAEPDKDRQLIKIAEIIGDKEAVEYDRQSLEEYLPVVMASNKLIGDIVFSNLDLKWNSKEKAWYSDGRLGLSHIQRNDVNALVDGFVEIRKTEKGDIVNMFMQLGPQCYYYFNFQENRLTAYSNNDYFNDVIAGKSKIDKAGFGEYVFILGDRPDMMSFINQFRQVYLGINEPYEMALPEPRVEETEPEFLQQEEEQEGVEAVTEEEIQEEKEKEEEQQQIQDDNLGF